MWYGLVHNKKQRSIFGPDIIKGIGKDNTPGRKLVQRIIEASCIKLTANSVT